MENQEDKIVNENLNPSEEEKVIPEETVVQEENPAPAEETEPAEEKVEDKENTAKELAPILNMDYDYLLKLLNQDAYQVELGPGGRGITELKKDKIVELNLPGIDFIETQKRYVTDIEIQKLCEVLNTTFEELTKQK